MDLIKSTERTMSCEKNFSAKEMIFSKDSKTINNFLAPLGTSTQRAYLAILKRFFEDKKFMRVSSVRREHVKSFLTTEAKSKSASSVAQKKSALVSFFDELISLDYMDINPARNAKTPKVDKTSFVAHVPNTDEILKIIEHCKHYRDKKLIWFLYISGARVSEVLRLQYKNFTRQGESYFYTIYGKGSKSRRLSISAKLYGELEIINEPGSEGYIFCRTQKNKGGPVSRSYIYRVLKEAAKKACILKEVRVHSLRHANAVEFLKRGGDALSLQNNHGHVNRQSTQVYIEAFQTESTSKLLE